MGTNSPCPHAPTRPRRAPDKHQFCIGCGTKEALGGIGNQEIICAKHIIFSEALGGLGIAEI